jgi:hypothetical protein
LAVERVEELVAVGLANNLPYGPRVAEEILRAAPDAGDPGLTGQLELFSDGSGGTQYKRTDEASRFYMARVGNPLLRGAYITELPIIANGWQVVHEPSKVLGMSRGDAAGRHLLGDHAGRPSAPVDADRR